jgi:hypothetical protein
LPLYTFDKVREMAKTITRMDLKRPPMLSWGTDEEGRENG